jgi:aminotransferase in exopolysaccharide biosynthesis
VAVVNGTEALHLALLLAGVKTGDEVITQPLTFVATANAISYCGALPVFVDVEKSTLGLDPDALADFLETHAHIKEDGYCHNKKTGRRISACVPMHTFGHPCKIDHIVTICKKHHIPVVEDAAEALGSFYKGQHAGTFGLIGILSFNGNKPVTTGGGGIILTDSPNIAQKARHLSTTAKVPHPWEFNHDQVGYNCRMPNVNAAIGCAQMENFSFFLQDKRKTAETYSDFFRHMDVPMVEEPPESRSNYWLNAILLKDKTERYKFIRYADKNDVQARPVWTLMNHLPMFNHCQCGPLDVANRLEDRVVNLASSVKQ